MGAWGEGVFENDTALDWLGELEEHGAWRHGHPSTTTESYPNG